MKMAELEAQPQRRSLPISLALNRAQVPYRQESPLFREASALHNTYKL